MTLVIEAVAAAALGAAIISLIIILRFFMSVPVCKTTGGKMYTVLSISGSAPELDVTIDGLCWLIKTGRLNCGILIIDCGLEPQARKAAEILARNDIFITLCRPEEAAGILTEGF